MFCDICEDRIIDNPYITEKYLESDGFVLCCKRCINDLIFAQLMLKGNVIANMSHSLKSIHHKDEIRYVREVTIK